MSTARRQRSQNRMNDITDRLGVKQEAQLPQRNCAAAAHMYLGWLIDLLMITLGGSVHRTRQNRRQYYFLHLNALIQKVRAENGF